MKFRPERYARILDTYATLAEHRRDADRAARNRDAALPRPQSTPDYLARLAGVAQRNGGDLLLGVPLPTARRASTSTAWSRSGTSPPQPTTSTTSCRSASSCRRASAGSLSVLQIPLSDFSRGGHDQPPLAAAGQRVAVNICYEDAFGDEIARALPRGDAARQRVERRLVRRFARAGAAPADRAAARARDRPHAPRRDQHRRHRRDRPRRRGAGAPAAVHRRPSRSRARRATPARRRTCASPTGRLSSLSLARAGGCAARRPARIEPVESAELHADLPTTHPPAQRILGPPGLRAAAALRHGSRRRHLPHRDLPARHRPRAVARRLRAALAPAEGRPLRRKPEPPAALLPVPGGAQALAGRHPGSLPRLAATRSASIRRSTTSASSRTTGNRPTLGAWGLGWEVWLDGMEVTQFTYFQQVGGLDCKPVLGEITYGLERLAMYLQGVENVFDLVWTPTASTLRRRVPPERSRAVALQLRARRTPRCCSATSRDYEARGEAPDRGAAARCPPTRWC